MPTASAQTTADFFVDRFGDSLDHTNPEDVPLATSLTMKVSNPSLEGGHLRADLNGAGWISLLWPGVPGGIPHGREGVVNPIDASRYGRPVFRMSVDVAQPVIALCHTCAAASETCQGGTVRYATPRRGRRRALSVQCQGVGLHRRRRIHLAGGIGVA